MNGYNDGMSELIRQIDEVFGWKVKPGFDDLELAQILAAGNDIGAMISRCFPGYDGKYWVWKNLGKAIFHKGGLPQKLVGWANKSDSICLVFVNRHVWLSPKLFQLPGPKRWLVHELGHVLDNHFHSMGVWFGGGPSDRLVEILGRRPKTLRWQNTKSLQQSIPSTCMWTIHNNNKPPKYGDNSSADYFAECFTWMVYNEEYIPNPARLPMLNLLRSTLEI